MKYTEFVKANYHKVQHLPHKERFKHLGAMWKKEKGGGLLDDGFGMARKLLFGGELDTKGAGAKRGRKAKGGVLTAGALPSGAVVSAGALPMKRGRKAKGGVLTAGALPSGAVVSAGGLKDVHGAGIFSSLLGAIGL